MKNIPAVCSTCIGTNITDGKATKNQHTVWKANVKNLLFVIADIVNRLFIPYSFYRVEHRRLLRRIPTEEHASGRTYTKT